MTSVAPVGGGSASGFPTFSAGEYARRRSALDQLLARSGLDALVVYGRSRDRTVHWLTNWLTTIEALVVWVPGAEPTLLVQLGNHLETVPCCRWRCWLLRRSAPHAGTAAVARCCGYGRPVSPR